jgi:hypothetical protein
MSSDERRETTGEQHEKDPRRFEKAAREVREEQSPSTGEEGTEEDRRQWEKTRDVGKEAAAAQDAERRTGARGDPLEAPPGD